MRFRSLTLFALAAGLVALSAADATAGPLLRLLRERRAARACPCPCCPQQFAPQPAPAGQSACPSCPGGVCPLPGVKTVGATAAPAPQAAGGVFDRLGDGPIRRKILLEVVRNGAERKLAADKGISRAAAKELVDKVGDDAILTHVHQQWGATADGGKLQNFLQWVLDHKEQIIAFVLAIVSLFGSGG